MTTSGNHNMSILFKDTEIPTRRNVMKDEKWLPLQSSPGEDINHCFYLFFLNVHDYFDKALKIINMGYRIILKSK